MSPFFPGALPQPGLSGPFGAGIHHARAEVGGVEREVSGTSRGNRRGGPQLAGRGLAQPSATGGTDPRRFMGAQQASSVRPTGLVADWSARSARPIPTRDGNRPDRMHPARIILERPQDGPAALGDAGGVEMADRQFVDHRRPSGHWGCSIMARRRRRAPSVIGRGVPGARAIASACAALKPCPSATERPSISSWTMTASILSRKRHFSQTCDTSGGNTVASKAGLRLPRVLAGETIRARRPASRDRSDPESGYHVLRLVVVTLRDITGGPAMCRPPP